MAFRSHKENDESKNKGNFLKILELISIYDEKINNFSRKRIYTSPTIQNELIEIVAEYARDLIKREIIKNKYFSLSAVETKNVNKHEELVVNIRYVSIKGNVEERIIGFRELKEFKAENIFLEIKNVLNIYDLDIKNLRGQCYDNANVMVMSGIYQGVKTLFLKENSYALFFPNLNHCLNLVYNNTFS